MLIAPSISTFFDNFCKKNLSGYLEMVISVNSMHVDFLMIIVSPNEVFGDAIMTIYDFLWAKRVILSNVQTDLNLDLI